MNVTDLHVRNDYYSACSTLTAARIVLVRTSALCIVSYAYGAIHTISAASRAPHPFHTRSVSQRAWGPSRERRPCGRTGAGCDLHDATHTRPLHSAQPTQPHSKPLNTTQGRWCAKAKPRPRPDSAKRPRSRASPQAPPKQLSLPSQLEAAWAQTMSRRGLGQEKAPWDGEGRGTSKVASWPCPRA